MINDKGLISSRLVGICCLCFRPVGFFSLKLICLFYFSWCWTKCSSKTSPKMHFSNILCGIYHFRTDTWCFLQLRIVGLVDIIELISRVRKIILLISGMTCAHRPIWNWSNISLALQPYWNQDKIAAVLPTTFSNKNSSPHMDIVLFKCHWNSIPRVQLTNILALFRVMAWHRISNKPLSEPIVAQFTEEYVRQSGWMN